jgi:hypothetical protein
MSTEDDKLVESLCGDIFQALLRELPGGINRYGGENPTLGKIKINRRDGIEPGFIGMYFQPNDEIGERFGFGECYLGVFSLRYQDYHVIWENQAPDQFKDRLPIELMNDVDTAMGKMGYTKEARPRDIS